MKKLTVNDINELKRKAGYGEGPVTIAREDFDALIDAYGEGYYYDRFGDFRRRDRGPAD